MDFETLLRFAAALAAVLGLIALLAALAKKYGLANRVRAGAGNRRIGVVESVALDARRQLVLVRRDGAEHLLLIGPSGDLVVEQNIDQPEATA